MNVESNAAKVATPNPAQQPTTLSASKGAARGTAPGGMFTDLLNQARDAERTASRNDTNRAADDEPVRGEPKSDAEDSSLSSSDDDSRADPQVAAGSVQSEPSAALPPLPRAKGGSDTADRSQKDGNADQTRAGSMTLGASDLLASADPAALTTAVQTGVSRSGATRLGRVDTLSATNVGARATDPQNADDTGVPGLATDGSDKTSRITHLAGTSERAGSRDTSQPSGSDRPFSEIAALELQFLEGKATDKNMDSASLLSLNQTLSTVGLKAADVPQNLLPSIPPPSATYSIAAPVGTAEFAESLASHLGNMTTNSIDRAEIQLNPRELGPIRIEISVKDKETSIVLSATQPMTMAALEQSSNTLRNLLSDQGLSLRQLDINAGHAGHGQSFAGGERGGDQARSGQQHASSGLEQPSGVTPALRESLINGSQRLLDLFA